MVNSYADLAGRLRDAIGVFLADESIQAIAGVYRRGAAVSATPGDGILINATQAGTVALTLANGGVATVTVAVGTTILPGATASWADYEWSTGDGGWVNTASGGLL